MKKDKIELIDMIFAEGTITFAIYTAMLMLSRWSLDAFCAVSIGVIIVAFIWVLNSNS